MPYENGIYRQPTKTVTERVEEWLGEDCSRYEWVKDATEYAKCACGRPMQEILDQHKDMFDQIAENTEKAWASNYGGWPRIWQKVHRTGMCSRWPYWYPRPCVSVMGTLGIEVFDWLSLTGVEIRG